jgi:hypothetical protein
MGRAFSRARRSRGSLVSEERPVTTIPIAVPSAPLGIVIKNGGPAPKPVRFWAYMWAADEETSQDHWHQRVPTEHAA